MAVPGTTIWLTAGNHLQEKRLIIQSSSLNVPLKIDRVNTTPPGLVQDGTADKPIRLQGVSGTRPVIDFAPHRDKAGNDTDIVKSARGLIVWAHYWEYRNLEIKNAADNCVNVAGSHNAFEDLDIHDCGDTGLQITVPTSVKDDKSLGAHNKIVNCDSHGNFDKITDGENADGFAAKDRVGPGNEFRGCRAWGNTDDGWDFFYCNESIKLENCWAFDMKHPKGTGNSDGNGFKLGGQRKGEPTNKANHQLKGCFAFDNPAVGFDLNNNKGSVSCSGCGAWNNKKANFESGIKHSGDVKANVSAKQAREAKRNADGSLPSIQSL